MKKAILGIVVVGLFYTLYKLFTAHLDLPFSELTQTIGHLVVFTTSTIVLLFCIRKLPIFWWSIIAGVYCFFVIGLEIAQLYNSRSYEHLDLIMNLSGLFLGQYIYFYFTKKFKLC